MRNWIVIVIGMSISMLINAQQDNFGWRVGVGIGHMTYFGDLNEYFSNTFGKYLNPFASNQYAAYDFTIERRINFNTSALIGYSRGSLGSNDRSDTENLNFDRSLNFKTNLQSFKAGVVFRADNDRFLGVNTAVAPYLFVGVGLLHYRVFADLQDAQGEFYDYTLEEVIQDEVFETELSNLSVNGIDYGQWSFQIPIAVGIRFRLMNRLSLHFQSELSVVFTDFLDDVSNLPVPETQTPLQAYAYNPNPNYTPSESRVNTNNINDLYTFNSVSLRYNFGHKRAAFKAPIFYVGELEVKASNEVDVVEPITDSTVVRHQEIVSEAQLDSTAMLDWERRLRAMEIKLEEALKSDKYPTEMGEAEALRLQNMELKQELDSLTAVLQTATTPIGYQRFLQNESEKIIEFLPSSSVLTDSNKLMLDEVAGILGRYPELRLQVNGHIGKEEYSEQGLNLSQKRAEAVKLYLSKEYEISPDRIILRYYSSMDVAAVKTNRDFLGGKAVLKWIK